MAVAYFAKCMLLRIWRMVCKCHVTVFPSLASLGVERGCRRGVICAFSALGHDAFRVFYIEASV